MKIKPIILSSLLLALTTSFPIGWTIRSCSPMPSCRKSMIEPLNAITRYYPTIINVSDYEGETDSEKIQKALNDVPPEGAIVFIPSGVWQAYNLTAKSKTILKGTNNTIIRRPGNTTLPFLTFQNRSEFTIVDLIFEGQNITQATGILILNCTRFQFLNNTLRQISHNAIRITGKCTQFSLARNKLVHCNIAPIILFGSPGERLITNFTITQNLLIDGTENGKIGVAFAARGTISNNTILHCEHGIATRCVSNITIKDNHIEDCSGYAFYLGTQPADPGSDNIQIIHNQAVNCNIGISRWYGSQSIRNITMKDNILIHNSEWDIHADFPATFINNTLTSRSKLKLLNANVKFIGNIDIEGQPIMPGDINHDLKIDMKDIGTTARLFGSTPSSPNWDPSLDTIQNGIIDMEDIAFVAKQFGLEWPGQ